MSGPGNGNTSQNNGGANKVDNKAGERSFSDIQANAVNEKMAEKTKRIQYINYLNKQYTNELAEYNRKIQDRAAELNHTVDEIRNTRNTLMAKQISFEDYEEIFEIGNEGGKKNKDWSFAKKIAKKFTDEKRKTDKNFKFSKANSKQMLDEIKASPDYYYDFIEYKLHPDDNYSPGSKQWTKADIKALVADVDLSTWEYDNLKDLSKNGLVKIPRRKTSYGEVEASFRDHRLEETLKSFKLQAEELEKVKNSAEKLLKSEDNFKHLSGDNQVKAKENLSELIAYITDISAIKNNLFNESDFETKIKSNMELYSFLKGFTAPDPNSKQMSKSDKMMNSYLEFALSMNQIGVDSEQWSISEDQKDTINNIQHFIQTVTELNESYESRFEGNLYVPDPVQARENGENIHVINATGHNPVSGDKFTLNFVDKSNMPLFDHIPSPDDVMQGELGDCYMLASLSEIAAQDPDSIMNAMKDNGNTVTVRFFNSNHEPVYVTVDKSVPVKSHHTNDVYAKGSLWVQLMEKAYVCSGLHAGKTASFEKGDFNKMSYMDIDGGDENFFMENFLGKNSKAEISYSDKIYIDSEDESDLEQKIKESLADGKLVTAASYENSAVESRTGEGLQLKQAGIFTKHAYAVTKIETDNVGETYVTLRNPHAGIGLDADSNGELHYRDANEAGGYTRMSFSDFVDVFSAIDVYKADLGLVDRQRLPEARKLINTYAYAVEKITKVLDDNDNVFLSAFKNSEQFNKFHDAAKDLYSEMKNEAPNPEKIKEELQNFFDAVKNYKEYCENDKQIDVKTAEGRSYARYKMVKIADALGSVFEQNRNKDPMDQWAEFSYKDFEASLDMPLTPYEQLNIADAKAKKLINGIEATNDKEVRRKSYDSVINFLKTGWKKFNPVLKGKIGSDDLMKFYKENQADITMMAAVCSNSEKLASLMENDSFLKNNGIEKENFVALCERVKPIYEGIKMCTDVKEYKMERSLPDLAKITGTPREKYREAGYGYKDEARNLYKCIETSKSALIEFAAVKTDSIQAENTNEIAVDKNKPEASKSNIIV